MTRRYIPTDHSARMSLRYERTHHTTDRYRVVRYAADGCSGEYVPGGHSDGDCIVSGVTLDEAIASAREAAGGNFGAWVGAQESDVIGFEDSRAEGCGGYMVQRLD